MEMRGAWETGLRPQCRVDLAEEVWRNRWGQRGTGGMDGECRGNQVAKSVVKNSLQGTEQEGPQQQSFHETTDVNQLRVRSSVSETEPE